jgi:hypothetical protein
MIDSQYLRKVLAVRRGASGTPATGRSNSICRILEEFKPINWNLLLNGKNTILYEYVLLVYL